MNHVEHHLHWIKVFSAKMREVPIYSNPWHDFNVLRARQIREWRKHTKPVRVK